MASAFHSSALPHSIPQVFNNQNPLPVHPPPAGTFSPGTKVQVGSHRVIVQRYLSEGGFAHVYLVKLPQPLNNTDDAVLKRVAVPDKDALANMRTEVETMKKLKGHRHIVTYIDSHASQLQGGGYEVFLLMEFCNGGGLIDLMNTRLQNRLTEPEILEIFADVAEGVACMHYLKPPLLHRDLKVENVLIKKTGNSQRYKLCDFGSAAPPRPAATTAVEGRLIEEDIQRHTTLQYRSPEMVDVYRSQPIDEKSDIWALGVLLYKLCYYTTPFEEQGQMAILNASFRYPSYPAFSDRLKTLIASMLQERPYSRPNIYQVIVETCSMRGTQVPIKDIYAGRTQSETRRNQQMPAASSQSLVGMTFQAAPVPEKQVIPDIAPMRRGRPTQPVSTTATARPSPSPLRPVQSDPFAALDQPGKTPRLQSGDALSIRFPTLDQFSLMHDTDTKFEFDQKPVTSPLPANDLSQRVTQALAEEAFARPPQVSQLPEEAPRRRPTSLYGTSQPFEQKASNDQRQEQRKSPVIYQPMPQKPAMVSEGTMTSLVPSPSPSKGDSLYSPKLGYRFPASHDHRRSSSQPRPIQRSSTPVLAPDPYSNKMSSVLDRHSKVSTSSASSRPSLEGDRPTALDIEDDLPRSKSATSKPRPASYIQSNIEFLRSRQPSESKAEDGLQNKRFSQNFEEAVQTPSEETIKSSVEFLRAKEEEEAARKKEKRSSSGSFHIKRASLPSVSLSGTKTLLSGRFGDAFRKFESNQTTSERTASPSPDRKALPLIEGSEPAEDLSDDNDSLEETQDISPEMRRELERRRLSQEEKRVAEAQAEYKRLVASQGTGGPAPRAGAANRASMIQHKVRALLSGVEKPMAPRTAEGYGHYTDQQKPAESQSSKNPYSPDMSARPPPHVQSPSYNAQPTHMDDKNPYVKVSPRPMEDEKSSPFRSQQGLPSAPTASLPVRVQHRPSAPPKPPSLRQMTGSSTTASAPSVQQNEKTASSTGTTETDDWETAFNKKYPSLSGIEMVETEIEKGRPQPPMSGRIRDV